MRLDEVMTRDPRCCTPDQPVVAAARAMAEEDVGALPVVESKDSPRLVGMITDRDIACRVVAEQRDLSGTTVRDAMSQSIVSVRADEPVERCCETMKRNQIRRVPVVDDHGMCCGIVSQADLAGVVSEEGVGAVVREVSRPIHRPARTPRG